MSKMRVHELAKQLAKDSKEIIKILSEQGIEKKPQSSVEDSEIELVKKALSAKKEAPKEEKKSQPEKKQEEKNEQ